MRGAGGRCVPGIPPSGLQSWAPAQVLFTAELRRRLPGGCGVVAAAVHPGEVMTDVVRTLPRPLQAVYRVAMLPFCLMPAEGAVLVVPGSARVCRSEVLAFACKHCLALPWHSADALIRSNCGAHAATVSE